MGQSEVDDKALANEVQQELEVDQQFVKSLKYEDVRSGQWFLTLLRRVVTTYEKNARAVYFQQKYPGMSADDVADRLINVNVKYAAVAGAIAGTAATASQISMIGSLGMTAALFVSTIGAEMVYLARIQMRLVLDLATLYDLQLDLDDPEDVLMIFGYALGVAPTDLLGKGLQIAGASTTRYTIKKYLSKETLKVVQDFGRRLGFRILRRTILKYAVPLVSASIGSGYNYITTKSIGEIAKAHFKSRGKVTDDLRRLVSRQNTYHLVFPAAVRYIGQIEGELSNKQRDFYNAMLSRMSFETHTSEQINILLASEEHLLEAMQSLEDPDTKQTLLELLVLMAAYEGHISERVLGFLHRVSEHLNVPLNVDHVLQKAAEHQVIVRKHWLRRLSPRRPRSLKRLTLRRQSTSSEQAPPTIRNRLTKIVRRGKDNAD